ncbi:MAG: PIN domain-containing protein [Candidatus Aenigmarchaeota archaeon]|nr:PIN domain-containing protein [Candidatus Aenigmarchaeota archaeon]
MQPDLKNVSEDCVFFDTSILVYAFDAAEPEKQKVSKELIENVLSGKMKGAISSQVMGELYFVLTRKGMAKTEAEIIFNGFLSSESWIKLNYDMTTIRSAINSAKNISVELWDIVIAETSKENGINKIVTENEKDFSKIPGMKVVNPFK